MADLKKILLPVWPSREAGFFAPAFRLAETLLRNGGELVLLCVLPPKVALFGQAGTAAMEGREFLQKALAQAKFTHLKGDVTVSGRIAKGFFAEVVRGNLEGFALLILERDNETWASDFTLALDCPVLVCGPSV